MMGKHIYIVRNVGKLGMICLLLMNELSGKKKNNVFQLISI